MSRHTRGKAVSDGRVNYLSPSAMTKADPDQGGCLRQWHFRYVASKPEPEFVEQKKGTDLHAQIETYLTTGKNVLGPLALQGRRFIPEPGDDLLVEHAIDDGNLAIDTPGLQNERFPVIGYVDLVSQRTRVRLQDEDVTDPLGTVELVDWKTTSSIVKWAKSSSQLPRTIQMATYGEWAARRFGAAHVRLSHVYFDTKVRASRKASALVTRETLSTEWTRIERVALRIVQAATVEDSNQVEANTGACDAYRGCPHRSYCTAAGGRTIHDIFGLRPDRRTTVGVMDRLKNKGIAASPAGEVIAEKAALKRAEALAALPVGFAEAILVVSSSGRGFPKTSDAVHAAYSLVRGTGTPIGSGELLGLTVETPEEFVQLAQELEEEQAKEWENSQQPEQRAARFDAPALLPDDAAQPDLATAADPVEGWVAPSSPPPGVPAVAAVMEIGAEVAAMAAEAVKAKRTRRTKAEMEAARTAELAATYTETGVTVTQQSFVTAPATPLIIMQDVICSTTVPWLDPWIDAQLQALNAHAGLEDIRLAPNDSPYAYGRWRIALSQWVGDRLPEAGTYTVFGRGEITEAVLEGLRAKGAVIVRGVGR